MIINLYAVQYVLCEVLTVQHLSNHPHERDYLASEKVIISDFSCSEHTADFK